MANQRPSIIGIIISPNETMKLIRKKPVFWRTLIILSLFSLVLFGINGYYSVTDPNNIKLLLKKIPTEVLSQASEAEIRAIIGNLQMTSLSFIIIAGGMTSVLMPLLGASVLWLFLYIFGLRQVSYKQLFSFQVHLYTISILGILTHAILMIFTDGLLTIPLTNLSGLVSIQGSLKSVLQVFDIFTIWTVVLLGYGLKEIAQLTLKQAWIIAIGYFILLLILNMVYVNFSM